MRTLFLSIVFCALFFKTQAQLSTSKLFADHTVLQRNQPIPVWGHAGKKTKVTVSLSNQSASVTADDAGNWKVTLSPMPEGGPFVLNVASGKEKLSYSDVMLGEVWICGGQSNMEFQLKNALGYKLEQNNAARYPIRQFTVPHKISLLPEKELAGGQWTKADTNSVGEFTAVGYFFAKKLAQQLHVTVGLIYSNWGGTMAEDWISKDAMLASPELGPAAKTLPDTWDGVKERIDQQLKAYAYRKQPVTLFTADQLAAKPAAFFENWQKGGAPAQWQWMGKYYSYQGQGFMQRTIKLDSSYLKRGSVLRLGSTDADMALYINGKPLVKGNLPGTYQLDLPAGTWKPGDNSLLIDLQSGQKNPSWYGLGLNGTYNDLYIRFADTTINLADNNWHTMPDLSKPYHFDFQPNNTAFLLFNGMINPLVPYAVEGVIWYQGESNADQAIQYRTTFPLMINNWRSKWKQDFPFLFVQLASFGGFQDSNVGSRWAELREAQSLTLQLPKTGMAVTTDIGEPLNIHPRNKADVGIRLASKALTDVYKLRGFAESPLFSSADFSEEYAVVNFTHADNGLMAKDKYGYLKGFEIAGADHKFYYAQAAITANNKVKVWCSQVTQPVAVRYAWTDAPIEANLYNVEGFPVSPFRSDSWKALTEGNKFE